VRSVDTNVLVRLLTRDDSKQVAAAEAFVARGAWVPQLVLAETTWVLTAVYDRGPDEIAAAVEMLLNHAHLSIQDPETVTAAVARFRRRPSVGFSDCLVAEIAKKAGHIPVGTFDRDFARFDDVERLSG
jgi:predicted nucleic-acid-binding protein